MRHDQDLPLELPWQLKLCLGAAATVLSALVLLAVCAIFQHLANQVLEAPAITQPGTTPAHLFIGFLWPVLLLSFFVMSVGSYLAFRRIYTNLLNRLAA